MDVFKTKQVGMGVQLSWQDACIRCPKHWVQSEHCIQVGVVAHACNHSHGEMGQEDPKFQVILGDTENLMLAQST